MRGRLLLKEDLEHIFAQNGQALRQGAQLAEQRRVFFTGYSKSGRYTAQTGWQASWAQLSARSELTGCGCSCRACTPAAPCTHVAALLCYLALNPGQQRHMPTDQEQALEFLQLFDPPPAPEEMLRLELFLTLAQDRFYLGLRMGEGRLYVVRDVSQLFDAMRTHKPLLFGKGFTFTPGLHQFAPADERALRYLAQLHGDMEAYGGMPATDRHMILTFAQVERLLRTRMGCPFQLQLPGEPMRAVTAAMGPLPCTFHLSALPDGIELTTSFPAGARSLTPSAAFLLLPDERALAVPERFRGLVQRHLAACTPQGASVLRFTGPMAERLVSEALPTLRQAGQVCIDDTLGESLLQAPIDVRIYLDVDGAGITARVAFGYGEHTIDPFGHTPAGGPLIVRDTAQERAVLDALSRYGFTVRPGGAQLCGEDAAIYAFFEEGVAALQALSTVYVSDAFGAMRPRRAAPRGRLAAKAGGMLFSLTLQLEDGDEENLRTVLAAMREKRVWVRLPDGAFLTLPEDEGWQAIAEDAGPDGSTAMGRSQALCVGLIARQAGLDVDLDMESASLLQAIGGPVQPPQTLRGVLRPYQQRGLEWLWGLYRLGLGGVLADDMGLGKTVQVLALIDTARQEHGPMPSLIIAPTSLTYNWQEEAARFTPHLKAVVLCGTPEERRASAMTADADLIIASYAQLRRDEDTMSGLNFRFCILDEAQQVKNPFSQGARAAQKLNAQGRFALTDTPMENHPGELWSVFAFALPGYLGDLTDFMQRHGTGQNASVLARRIAPFLMRRLKSDVLRDLPDKIDHLISVDLPDEQMAVYRATLLRLREDIGGRVHEGGVSSARMRILAAITRLRQICCHPSLYLEGYEGSSAKLDVLGELAAEAIQGGHRLLVFSQFTSMLRLIHEALSGQGIVCFMLTGETPPIERTRLVSAYNGGEGQVFLLSLKAGGAGLNLTGADTVVHFDPWWNPAVEQQASDRAHRIGQTRAVHVIRLIARGTVEEQVVRLQERKQQLIDQLVRSGETLPSQLTPADLYELLMNKA